jgi:hypothetical protein
MEFVLAAKRRMEFVSIGCASVIISWGEHQKPGKGQELNNTPQKAVYTHHF